MAGNGAEAAEGLMRLRAKASFQMQPDKVLPSIVRMACWSPPFMPCRGTSITLPIGACR
jgi:hypothetical protein